MSVKKLLLGYDVGSSSLKASLLNAETGEVVASAQSPEVEMAIDAPQIGWAEQHPDLWWDNLVKATAKLHSKLSDKNYEIEAIGISYQMHGLVVVDKNQQVLHPSIIWCDSRAVEIGDKAFSEMGKDFCLANYLNSPGNFTASKLKWVKENKPAVYEKIYKAMLPGDYIAMRLTGEICTTASGLSEGIFWNFKEDRIADELLKHYGIEKNLLPEVLPTFSNQGELNESAAKILGLKPGIKVAYRAGDQPNNAFSLNVLNKGEIAATAGTSGVVYGITDLNAYDNESRVNAFAHVNYTSKNPLKGVLLCINGTGILYNWLKNEMLTGKYNYPELNDLAANTPVGAEGLLAFPYGNGAERSLSNKDVKAQFTGISFNRHKKEHMIRAAQEGIVFAFNYGVEIMKDMGLDVNLVRAGDANMFLSPLFREAFADTCNVEIEIYNTDGSQGAARGAGVGAGVYKSFGEAFGSLKVVRKISPSNKKSQYVETYQRWKEQLLKLL